MKKQAPYDNSFTIRTFRMASDVPSLLSLRATIEEADRVGTGTSEAALRAEFKWSGHDPENDRWVIESPDKPGEFVGHAWLFAQTARRSILFVAVHPRFRRRGLGAILLSAAIGRAKETGAEQIVSGTEITNTAGDAFLRKHGFIPAGHNRFMTAPAGAPAPEPGWPSGFRLSTYAELLDLSYVAEACNACYTDMWGHAQNTVPSTAKSFAKIMETYPDHFSPEGMFVLFGPDGRAAGVCFSRVESPEPGPPAKVIDSPGVAPPYRHLELQRPLTLAAMRWLNNQAQGEIRLETWGDSEEAAAIYQELGFILEPKDHEIEYLMRPERH